MNRWFALGLAVAVLGVGLTGYVVKTGDQMNLLSAFRDRGKPPLWNGFSRIESAPRDGTIIVIALVAPGYQGWTDLFYWGSDGYGSKQRWLKVNMKGSGLMDEDERMADGKTSSDLLQWKPLPPHQIEFEIANHERAIELLRAHAARIAHSPE